LIVRLRATMLAALTLLFCPVLAKAQDTAPDQKPAPEPTTTLFLARTGQSLTAPYAGVIHYLEFFQIRHRWIVPDVGYVDFAHNNYREFFVGGGRVLIDNKYASWEQELLYVQASGSAAAGAKYLQPFTLVRIRFTPKFTNETEYFAYLPINHTGRFHQVLERAKFEYAVKKRWKVGAGYAGVKLPSTPWIHKPLLTTTISTKVGAFELWLQKIPGGEQLELRYALIHLSHQN
jgi:hypothetical protein